MTQQFRNSGGVCSVAGKTVAVCAVFLTLEMQWKNKFPGDLDLFFPLLENKFSRDLVFSLHVHVWKFGSQPFGSSDLRSGGCPD